MFNKKKPNSIWDYTLSFETLEKLKQLSNDIVFCEECGVAIKKDKAKKVDYSGTNEYYCDRHAPNYDKVIEWLTGPIRYYKSEVEVNIKGHIIKNK